MGAAQQAQRWQGRDQNSESVAWSLLNVHSHHMTLKLEHRQGNDWKKTGAVFLSHFLLWTCLLCQTDMGIYSFLLLFQAARLFSRHLKCPCGRKEGLCLLASRSWKQSCLEDCSVFEVSHFVSKKCYETMANHSSIYLYLLNIKRKSSPNLQVKLRL